MSDLQINSEVPGDAAAIRAVHRAAFGREVEGAIVDALREAGALTISLVASRNGIVCGHVACSPVETAKPGALMLGLGPVGVAPDDQRQGSGAALIREAISLAFASGWDGVVVLGHPQYYRRFGFVPASRFGISSEYDVPDDVFMALELQPSGLTDCAGLVRYHQAFALATT